MTDWKDKVENMVYSGRIKVPYLWNVGKTGSRFLVAIRDNKEIWGNKCPACGRVYVPPVKTCGECFVPTEEWVKLSDRGVLESFTVVHYSHEMQPRKAPLAYGLIKLDGADGAILHLIGDTDFAKLKTGMKVKAVFAEQREGTIADIKHFTPA
ncbi:MAG: Zn-ribbon domain-containing OB-fold protein [Syntrophales bacterium]